MKKFLTLCFSIVFSALLAQKQDFIWTINHTCGLSEATQLDFNASPVAVSVVDIEMCVLITNGSICDESGELLLYTNGLAVYNKNGEIVENGDSLNFGYWSISAGIYGYNVPQGAFFIQKPGNNNIYYLFHMFAGFENGTIPLSPRYSVIDLSYNNGLGEVVEKNVPLLAANQFLNYIQATAVRHANGRDWWIVVPNHMGPEYFRFLLTPNGIEGPWVQEIGFREATDNFWVNGFGQRVFSPNGSKFADYDFDNFTQVLDFDRCTGLFSNARLLAHTIDPSLNNGGAGVAFSLSGRFLYISTVNNGYSLYQYDTEVSDILASEIEIVHCPLINQQVECGVGNMLLAPDGKIYIGGTDTISYSIIHEPDSLGSACNFELDGLVFPLAYPESYFPYWPNYRLGALEGSACDTILSSEDEVISKSTLMQISPNPASDEVTVSIASVNQVVVEQMELMMINQLGQVMEVSQYEERGGQYRFDVSALPAGIYFMVLKSGGEMVGATHFSVVR